MKKSTLYKLLGYAALLVVLVFAANLMDSTSSRSRFLVYLAGGSMMYWGVMVWLYGMKHRNDSPQEQEERKQLASPRKPRSKA